MLKKKPRTVNRALLDEIKKEVCIACGYFPTDPAHIHARGMGGARGPDERWNVLPLCRRCHRLQEDKGWRFFLNQFPVLWFYLQTIGWEWLGDKLWNDRLSKTSTTQ